MKPPRDRLTGQTGIKQISDFWGDINHGNLQTEWSPPIGPIPAGEPEMAVTKRELGIMRFPASMIQGES